MRRKRRSSAGDRRNSRLPSHAERKSWSPARVRDCNWPIASIRASRAFARASDMAKPCDDARSETAESDSKPTAITVSNTISEMVTTSAKPRL